MFWKNNIGYWIASIAFFIACSIKFMDNQTVLGFIYVTFAFVFLTFAIVVKKPHEIKIDKIEKDQIFQEYIKEGNKIKAVKRCREITMCSLKDANDYVESNKNESNYWSRFKKI